MKISSRSVLFAIAFSTIVGLQAFVIHQQSQTNQSLEAKISQLQDQINSVSSTNSTLLAQVEKIESDLQTKSRQLLSMNY